MIILDICKNLSKPELIKELKAIAKERPNLEFSELMKRLSLSYKNNFIIFDYNDFKDVYKNYLKGW